MPKLISKTTTRSNETRERTQSKTPYAAWNKTNESQPLEAHTKLQRKLQLK